MEQENKNLVFVEKLGHDKVGAMISEVLFKDDKPFSNVELTEDGNLSFFYKKSSSYKADVTAVVNDFGFCEGTDFVRYSYLPGTWSARFVNEMVSELKTLGLENEYMHELFDFIETGKAEADDEYAKSVEEVETERNAEIAKLNEEYDEKTRHLDYVRKSKYHYLDEIKETVRSANTEIAQNVDRENAVSWIIDRVEKRLSKEGIDSITEDGAYNYIKNLLEVDNANDQPSDESEMGEE